MKTRERELAKPGIYGTVDNPQIVTERDLREIAETFADIKKAPVSLNGHWPDPAKPRLGNVVAVAFDEATKKLSGTIEEQDALYDAVEEGYFPDVSIGAKRRASDSKMYLHHLAYLGEEPPAIKDLVSGIVKNLAGDEGIAAADSSGIIALPSATALQLNLADITLIQPQAASSSTNQTKTKEATMPRTLEEAEADLTAEREKTTGLEAELQKYKDQLAALAQKYPDEGIALSDADPRVNALMQQLRSGKKADLLKSAAGKLPKAKEPLLLALSDTLSVSAAIELSDTENGKKENKSQLELLADIFQAIPNPVQHGRLNLSDPEDSGQSAPIDMSKLMSRV